MPKQGSYNAEYHMRAMATFEGATRITIDRTRTRAKKKKKKWGLDLQWMRDQAAAQNYKCARTGIDFVYCTGQSPWQMSIDRIDQTRGYTKDNVQLVCLMYNLAKNMADDEDILFFARKLSENQ